MSLGQDLTAWFKTADDYDLDPEEVVDIVAQFRTLGVKRLQAPAHAAARQLHCQPVSQQNAWLRTAVFASTPAPRQLLPRSKGAPAARSR